MDSMIPARVLIKPFFTPILISLLGISAFAVAITLYQHLMIKYCMHRRQQFATGGPQGQSTPAHRGVDKDVLNMIPVIPFFTIKRKSSVDRRECVVCLGQMELEEKVRVLPACKHVFHVLCVDEWLTGHSSCPVCRATVVAPTTDLAIHWPDPERGGVTDQQVNSSTAASLEEDQQGRSMRLKRSISIDNSFLVVDTDRANENSPSLSSHSCSTKTDVTESKSSKIGLTRSLDFVPSKLLRSLPRLKMGDAGMRKETILPY